MDIQTPEFYMIGDCVMLRNMTDATGEAFMISRNIGRFLICAEVMGKTQAQQLRRLIGFTFKRHPSINWPEDRLAAVEQHTQKRVRQLLGLSWQKQFHTGAVMMDKKI